MSVPTCCKLGQHEILMAWIPFALLGTAFFCSGVQPQVSSFWPLRGSGLVAKPFEPFTVAPSPPAPNNP